MNTEVYIITASVGFVGTLAGLAIGYYKSKAELPNVVDTRVKAHCATCSLKKEVTDMEETMKGLAQDLKQGSRIFNSIKIDMAVIKTKLGIKSDIAELKQAIASLEKGPVKNE